MIRWINEHDYTEFLQMAHEFYASDAVLHPLPDHYHRRNFEEMCKPDGWLRGYMFEVDGKAVGFAMIGMAYSTEVAGKAAWIEDVYVREGYRSQGIGKAFFARLEQDFGGKVRRFRLEVEEENERAVALYRSLGFEVLPYMQMIRDFPDDGEGADHV